MLPDQAPAEPRSPVGPARGRARELGTYVLNTAQAVITFGGLLLVVLLQIPWLEEPLRRIGFDNQAEIGQVVVVAVLVAVYLEVRSLRLRDRVGPPVFTHLSDPADVYRVVHERALAVGNQEEKVLDVLGLSLLTAWPTIKLWMNRTGQFAGWRIRFAAVEDDGSGFASVVPDEWFDESTFNLTQIKAISTASLVAQQGIELEAYGYSFVPVLHGFRLGNGDLFFSLLTWGDDGTLNREVTFYEFLPYSDDSPSAQALRDTFDSWFARACARPWRS